MTVGRWIYLEPEVNQLPTRRELYARLRNGETVVVYFESRQAEQGSVHEWCRSVGLVIEPVRSLALTEDDGAVLSERRGSLLLRYRSQKSRALPTSYLTELRRMPLTQTYVLRDQARNADTAGKLTISFAAEQFSDRAIGEIWDGKNQTVVADHRVSELVAAVSGRAIGDSSWKGVSTAETHGPSVKTMQYHILEDGGLLVSGTVDRVNASTGSANSLAQDPTKYAATLYRRALAVAVDCGTEDGVTPCRTRVIGPDMVEWLLTVARKKGELVGLELLHERRFSGLARTYNVVFIRPNN
jgi:hypothetical protein